MKIKVVIADDSATFRKIVQAALSTFETIDIIANAGDGFEVLQILRNYEVDVLVMDIIMPNLDGIATLECLRMEKFPKLPKVIMVSSMENERTTKRIMELGAMYFFVKPFDMNSLARRILEFGGMDIEEQDSSESMRTFIKRNSIEREVSRIIQEIGVSPHLQGYKYIRVAIMKVIDDIGLLGAVTTKLYPMIGDMFESNSNRVERSMRHAVETAWNKGRIDVLNRYFGYTVSEYRGKPTNSEFIAMIADYVRLRMID